MQLTPYNQDVIDRAIKAASIIDPIVFCGMFNDGHDFLYANLVKQISIVKSDFIPVFLDLSACSTGKQTLETLQTSTIEHLKQKLPNTAGYDELNTIYNKVCTKSTVILILYTGQAATVDKDLLLFLSRLRDLKRFSFSYVWLACTRIVFSLHQHTNTTEYEELLSKLFLHYIRPLVPRDKDNAMIIINNNENRYGKLTPATKQVILRLSGGHPGLIKTLVQQASEKPEWITADLNDERLSSKLNGILSDLPDSYKKNLFAKKQNLTDPKTKLLILYGYLKKHDAGYTPFTSLLNKYDALASSFDQKLLILSPTQRKVMEFFEAHAGTIIKRDILAEQIWGQNFQEKYSDWAIDQFISDFRNKLTLIHSSAKLVTKKSEGYIYIP